MKRNTKKKIKSFILKSITAFMVFLLMLSVSMLDSVMLLPELMFVVSLLWLALIAYANGYMTIWEEGEHNEQNFRQL